MFRPLTILVIVSCFAACQDQGKDERGLNYMPDMYDSNALESQDAFVVEEQIDGGAIRRTEVPVMQQPVAGTVSRDYQALDLREDLGAALVNPLAATSDVLRRGQIKYDIYCAVCHGKDGNVANGYVASKLTGVLSINTDNVAQMSDGEIYHIITHGRNRMPNYAAQLLPEDRWAVIHYLRALREAAQAKDAAKSRYQRLQENDMRFRPPADPVPEYQRDHYPDRLPQGDEAGQ